MILHRRRNMPIAARPVPMAPVTVRLPDDEVRYFARCLRNDASYSFSEGLRRSAHLYDPEDGEREICEEDWDMRENSDDC